jgi:hypothetical protein
MLLSGVLAGLALGAAIGRDWRRLGALHILWLPVLAVALAARALAPFVPAAGMPLYLLAIGLTGIVAAVNWRLPGAALIAVGSLLNLLVVAANGGMPVDTSSLEAAGGRSPQDSLHVPLAAATILGALADVIVIAPLRAAYSIGDVAIAVGGFLLPFVTLTRR